MMMFWKKHWKKVKTHISNGTTKKEFQVNKTKVSFKLEEITPEERVRMSIDDLNEVLSNTTNQEIDIRNLDSLKLYLEAYYQVRFNGIDVYLYLKRIKWRRNR